MPFLKYPFIMKTEEETFNLKSLCQKRKVNMLSFSLQNKIALYNYGIYQHPQIFLQANVNANPKMLSSLIPSFLRIILHQKV